MTNRFKIPDYRYLEDLEARKRGFDFNNPEDARQMYKLLKTRENEIDSIKKDLIRETNKKLYKIEGYSMKIVTTEQKDGKAYYLFVEPNLYGFELA